MKIKLYQDDLPTSIKLGLSVATDTETRDTGAVPIIDDLVNVTEDTGLTSAEAQSAFQEAVAEQIAANEAAKADMPASIAKLM